MSDPLAEIHRARFEERWPEGRRPWSWEPREIAFEPRFDEIRTADADELRLAVARSRPEVLTIGKIDRIFGISVFVDKSVPRGWLELRKGDELVERVRIA